MKRVERAESVEKAQAGTMCRGLEERSFRGDSRLTTTVLYRFLREAIVPNIKSSCSLSDFEDLNEAG